MICRARAGEPAPPLGAPVDAKQGLSGECVRSGSLVSCEDTEKDPRVDAAICRALGIGSLMAAPIVSDFRVVGLLEIFSPHPRAFTKAHETVLDRLVEMIPHREKTQPEAVSGVSRPSPSESGSVHEIREALLGPEPEVGEQVSQPVPEQEPEPAPTVPSHLFHLGLLGLVILVVAMVLGYLVAPMMEKRISPEAS